MRAMLIVLSLLVACGDSATRVQLAIHGDPALQIDRYQVRVIDRIAEQAVFPELDLLLPDEMAARQVEIEVWGLHAGRQVAFGSVMVTPALHDTIRAEVTLGATTCELWCELGTVACAEDGTVECLRLDDGCVGWGAVAKCPSDAPFCSNGTCSATCTDECRAGAAQCDSDVAFRTCGQYDGDPCLDWGAPTACGSKQSCVNGRCEQDATPACEPTDWVSEQLPETDGSYSAVAADAAGVHLVYTDTLTGNARLRHAFKPTGGSWQFETIDIEVSDDAVGLVLDATGKLHVTYAAEKDSVMYVYYARKSPGGSWTTTPVSDISESASPSIALGSTGQVYIAFRWHNQLAVANGTGNGTWQTTTITNGGQTSSITIDPSNLVHVVHYYKTFTTTSKLMYSTRASNGAWSSQVLDQTSGNIGLRAQIAQHAGTLSVLYYKPACGCLTVMRRPPGGTWSSVEVVSVTYPHGALVTDPSGLLYFTYHSNGMRVADGPPYVGTLVDGAHDIGIDDSLAIDANYGVHMSYQDDTARRVRYAYKRVCPP